MTVIGLTPIRHWVLEPVWWGGAAFALLALVALVAQDRAFSLENARPLLLKLSGWDGLVSAVALFIVVVMLIISGLVKDAYGG